jgi:hypothetical protein
MPRYKNQEPLAEPLPDLQATELEQHLKNRQLLREQLQEEVENQKIKEASLPPRVPSPSDHCSIEHTEPQRLARVSGIVNFRQPVEFEDEDNLEEKEKVFFGIPRLRHASKTITRPYQERRSIGVISTR